MESTTYSKSTFLAYYEKYMLLMGIVGQLMFYIQGVKIFSLKSAQGVSIVGFLVGFVCVSSWALYGVLIKNKILIISNCIAALGALFVIIGCILYS